MAATGATPKGDWWMRLPVVCVPVKQYPDGSFGFLTATLSDEGDGPDGTAAAATDAAPGRPGTGAVHSPHYHVLWC